VVTPEARMPVACSGGMAYAGRYSRCWKRDGHGGQNLTQAIANSCNVYFYQLGIRLGLDVLAAEGTRLGLRAPHRGGPPRRARRHLPHRPAVVPGPLRLAAPAQRGDERVHRPGAQRADAAPDGAVLLGAGRRRDRPRPPPPGRARPPRRDRPAGDPRHAPHRARRDGGGAGGGHRLRLAPGPLAAVREDRHLAEHRRRAKPHAWFTGFAGPRGGEPEVVVAVVVEFGESGSRAAAPLASRVAEFYLNRRHGVPNPPLPAESAAAGSMRREESERPILPRPVTSGRAGGGGPRGRASRSRPPTTPAPGSARCRSAR
jgi:penicillin-binding protein 2